MYNIWLTLFRYINLKSCNSFMTVGYSFIRDIKKNKKYFTNILENLNKVIIFVRQLC